MRVALRIALAIEVLGLAAGLASLSLIVRDAFRAATSHAVMGTVSIALVLLAGHALLGALAIGAIALARRAPRGSAIAACAVILLAYVISSTGGFGVAWLRADVNLTPAAAAWLIVGLSAHVLLASLAGAITLLAVLFSSRRRRSGAEDGRPSSKPGVS